MDRGNRSAWRKAINESEASGQPDEVAQLCKLCAGAARSTSMHHTTYPAERSLSNEATSARKHHRPIEGRLEFDPVGDEMPSRSNLGNLHDPQFLHGSVRPECDEEISHQQELHFPTCVIRQGESPTWAGFSESW